MHREFSHEFGFEKESSPFKAPNDEEVFVTREKEKYSLQNLRRINSAKPIWLKTTATSHAPLQRVRDDDITPEKPKVEAPIYSYNATTRGLI